jgi:hypothetical protein
MMVPCALSPGPQAGRKRSDGGAIPTEAPARADVEPATQSPDGVT